ncbi:MAG: hypothetical protein K1W30_15185 [Lachnospiraceae bacterium]
MIYSNDRKRCLSGWLHQNSAIAYNTALKLQKFLLFYECFSKVSGEKADFGHLRGYKRGPVFSQVWGDYTKERAAFDQAADESYSAGKTLIDEQRAKKCAFLVCVLSEGELSELTHAMNLWKSKEERILQGEYQVDLDEKDFNEKDARMISTLDQMYPIGLIEDSSIVNIDSRYFIFHKKDISRLIEQHFDTLSSLTENEQLCNPVFVEVDERGCLLID